MFVLLTCVIYFSNGNGVLNFTHKEDFRYIAAITVCAPILPLLLSLTCPGWLLPPICRCARIEIADQQLHLVNTKDSQIFGTTMSGMSMFPEESPAYFCFHPRNPHARRLIVPLKLIVPDDRQALMRYIAASIV